MSNADKTALAVTKLVEMYSSEFEKVLPRHMRLDHFMRCAVTYMKRNPGVGECTTESIMKSLMDAAQLGLAPDGLLGSAYLVPFNNKIKGRHGEPDRWEKTCQLIPGYRGMIDLARRSDQILSISAHLVLHGEEFDLDWGRPNPIQHKPDLDADPDANTHERVRGVYAIAVLKDGSVQAEYMSRAQIERIRDRSQAAKKGFSPWQTDWCEMARKTVVKRLCKYLPLSPEMARLITYDNDIEVVHDVQVEEVQQPQGSKADALARQIGHTPQSNIEDEINRAAAKREAAEEAAVGTESAGEEATESEHTKESPPASSVTPADILAIALDEAEFNKVSAAKTMDCSVADLNAMLDGQTTPTADQLNKLEEANVDVRKLREALGMVPAAAGKGKRKVE